MQEYILPSGKTVNEDALIKHAEKNNVSLEALLKFNPDIKVKSERDPSPVEVGVTTGQPSKQPKTWAEVGRNFLIGSPTESQLTPILGDIYAVKNTLEGVGDWFKLITQSPEEKNIKKIKETDRKKPTYFAAQHHLAPYLGYDNAVSNFFAEGLSNIYRASGLGWQSGEEIQPSIDVRTAGKNVTEEQAKAMIEMSKDNKFKEATDNMKKYQARYDQVNEEHGGIMAFMVAVSENPMYLRDVSFQSMAMMGSALAHSEDVRQKAAMLAPTVGVATMKAKVGKNPIGFGIGFMSGLFGAVSGTMDSGLSYQEFLQEGMEKEGLDFTPENVVKYLRNEEVITYKDPNGMPFMDITGTRAQILKARSIRRGVAITTIDTFTGVMSGGVAKGVINPRKKLISKRTRGALGVGTAIGGGLVSEIGGQTLGGQEYHAGDILTEGFAEKGIAMSGISVLPQMLKKKGTYSIRGEQMTEAKFIEEVNKMDRTTLAAADVKIENDDILLNQVNSLRKEAYYDSQIDNSIKDVNDREELIELQTELDRLKNKKKKAQKNEIAGVPAIEEKITEIQNNIENIIGKYKGAVDIGQTETAKEVRKEVVKVYLKATEKFAEVSSEQLDFDPYEAFDSNEDYVSAYVERSMMGMDLSNMTQQEIEAEANRLADEANNTDGVNVITAADGSTKIMINREVAAKYGAMNVGSHEVLHGVMEGALNQMTPENRKKLIKEFKSQIKTNIGQDVVDLIEKRLREDYGMSEEQMATTSEWFNALSDIVEDKRNNITYEGNKGFWNSIKDNVAGIFNKHTPYEKLSIETGEQAFNFMKEYSKSVKAGKLSESMVAFAKGKPQPTKDKADFSITNPRAQQFLDAEIDNKSLVDIVNFPQSTQEDRFAAAEAVVEKNWPVISNALKFNPTGNIPMQAVKEAINEQILGIFPQVTLQDGTKISRKTPLFDTYNKETEVTTFLSATLKPRQPEIFARAKAIGGIEQIGVDISEAKDIKAPKPTKQKPGKKVRKIKNLSEVNLDNKDVISQTIFNKITNILEQNPKNLNQQLEALIEKEFAKMIKESMGKISKIEGDVVVSEEYKAYHALNYENHVNALDVNTIKKNYNTLFDIKKIGREKDKKVNPETGVVTYPGKGIYDIKTNKAKFTKFFIEGGYTTLLARQKKLAELIAASFTKVAVNKFKKENSNDISTIVEAEIDSFLDTMEKQKGENRTFDTVKFSRTKNMSDFNALISEAIFGDIESAKYQAIKAQTNPLIAKEAERVIGEYNLDNHKETDGFKKRMKKNPDIPKEIKDKYFKRLTNKKNQKSIDEMTDFTNDLAATMDPEFVLNMYEDMFGFQYRYADPNRNGKKAKSKMIENAKGRKSNKNNKLPDNIDPTTVKKYMYNSKIGIMNRINTVLKKSYSTAKEKLNVILEKEGENIEQANKQNPKVLEYIITKAIQVVNKNPDRMVGVLRWLESATNTVKGLRALTGLTHIDVMAQSQEASVKHPDYKDAFKSALKSINKNKKTKGLNSEVKKVLAKEAALKKLNPKGEHLTPSANLMDKLASIIHKYSKLDMTSENVLSDFKLELREATKEFNQALGNKNTFDIIDDAMGTQAEGDVRLITGLKETRRSKRFYHISGAQSVGYIARTITQSEQFKKLSDKADKITKFSKSVNFSRSSKNKTRGMSAWDFDDTVARTKSGVRYTMPNPEGIPQPGRKVIFMAGGPGSGKSTVIKGLGLTEQGFKIVNQDISLEWLMKNHGLPTDMKDFTPEQASKFGKLGWDARMIAKRKKSKYQGRGDGIIVDGTGNSLQQMKNHVQEFKNKGYDVQMVFVETSLETALERNRARKERSLKDSIVKRTHESVQNNKEAFRELFGDNFTEVKTDNLKQGDAMPQSVVGKMDKFTKGYIKGRLSAEEFANEGADILERGGEFDFSEFDIVKEGEKGPLWGKAINRAKKYGLKDNYILTARPHAAKMAIYRFLDAQGLNIPFDNIITLENSTPEAKALWIAEKVGEGYNDVYFADDALQNVQAVQNMLDQFDVKGKTQQAKVKFSKSINQEFNDILENVTGIESKKRFSAIKARKRGESKGKFRFFIPPSHEDFVGLLYNFIGKGKEGNKHRDFFEEALIKPLNRAYRELNTARQAIANDYKALNKDFPNVKKKLTKKTPDGDFTNQDAIRVYLYDKHGHKVPGLTKTDQQKLVDLVTSDPELQVYAETLNVISKQDAYVNPTESWEAGDIRTDLDDATGRIGREQFFTEFFENADIIFSEENFNKIEAAYGADVVSALKDILYRTKTGRNRPSGQNKLVNKFITYLNGSVASTMFFNIRSAVLQQMSMVNFINYSDNNILAAAKAFANQKQYWADWAYLFNSDFMKQRRAGIKTDVNGAELAESVKNATNPTQAAIKKLLQLGFLPTQIGDNMAIATGGATYYRNRINTYLKQGLSQKEAEAKAFIDFQVLAEATQQSARPDMLSQQQASPLGKFILAFQNITSQMNRLGKKSFSDLYNRRISPEYKNAKNPQLQSDMSNLSRIAYYFAIQNLIFYSLQSALFMAMFDDDEEDEKWLNKKERMINGSIDSVLRGTGVMGGVIATLKNMAIKWHEQRDKGYNADESAVLMEMLNVSPPLGIKARKLVNAEKTLNYNKKVIDEMETFDIDNPMWSAVTSYTEATTNVPLNRLYNKAQNVRGSLDNQHNALERVLMFSGWSKWNLGIEDVEREKKKQKFSTKNKSKHKGAILPGMKIKKKKQKGAIIP